MTDETKPTITLDGMSYAVSDLTQTAHDTLQSIRFVEARLQQLQGELAVSQTAHVAYARALKAELEQQPPAEGAWASGSGWTVSSTARRA